MASEGVTVAQGLRRFGRNIRRPALLAASCVATAWLAACAGAAERPASAGTVAGAVHRNPNLEGVWLLKEPAFRLRTADGQEPPLKPEARTVYQRNLAALAKGDLSFDASRRRCTSPGVPRIMTVRQPFEFIQRPDQIMLLFSWNRLFRQIAMTYEPEVLYPTAMGKSTGRWEGDELVVTTTGRDTATLLDDGLPSSESLEVVERYRLRDGRLENRITINDPETFERPWDTVLVYERQAKMPDVEDVCLDRIGPGKPGL